MEQDNLCLCGCGMKIAKNKVFSHGHNRPWFGKHHSKETKQKLREINLGKKHSEETKKKLSLKLKGKIPKNLKDIHKNMFNENNHQWKGDNVKYRALHSWIRKRKPKQKFCNDCKKEKRLFLANISGEYKRDINDFEWLCQSCHMKKDHAKIKENKNDKPT